MLWSLEFPPDVAAKLPAAGAQRAALSPQEGKDMANPTLVVLLGCSTQGREGHI